MSKHVDIDQLERDMGDGGGKAVILEAEVSEFIPVAEANARRKIQAMNERADRLQSKVDLIRTQSEVVAIKAGLNDLPF